jgi:hypothetical protein
VNVQEHFIPALDSIARDKLSAPLEKCVIGSTPGPSNRKAIWQRLGYSAHFVERLPGQGESFVDDSLVAHMQRAILNVLVEPNPRPSEHLIVLVTGDGGENDGRPSFKQVVLFALRHGFNVKLICYVPNPVYRQFALEFPTQLQIVEIDRAMLEQVSAATPQQPVQQPEGNELASSQTFADAVYAYLFNRSDPATSVEKAVRLSTLGIALNSEKPAGKFKVLQCLLSFPSRFCVLDADKPGFTSVYIAPAPKPDAWVAAQRMHVMGG